MALDPSNLLLRKARDDHALPSRLARLPETSVEHLGFFCQQSIEKAMKSVLAHRGIPYPRTHDLTHLMRLLDENQIEFPAALRACDAFTIFASHFRYDYIAETDDGLESLDCLAAVQLSSMALEWATRLIHST